MTSSSFDDYMNSFKQIIGRYKSVLPLEDIRSETFCYVEDMQHHVEKGLKKLGKQNAPDIIVCYKHVLFFFRLLQERPRLGASCICNAVTM